MNKQTYVEYEEWLTKKLKNDPELAVAYLNEALKDEDPRVFLLALKDVLQAQGSNMTKLAEQAKLSRQHMYKVLSKKGNPGWDKLAPLLFNVLGYEMQLALKK